MLASGKESEECVDVNNTDIFSQLSDKPDAFDSGISIEPWWSTLAYLSTNTRIVCQSGNQIAAVGADLQVEPMAGSR